MSTLKILRQRQKTAHIISRMASAMKMVARSNLRRSQGDYKISLGGIQDLRQSMESLLFYVAQQEGVNPEDLAMLTNTPLSAFSNMDFLTEEENDIEIKDIHLTSPMDEKDSIKNFDIGPINDALSLVTILSLPRILRPGHALAPWIVLVMTSKGGLCGGFNQSLLKTTRECLKSFDNRGIPTRLWAFGEKGKTDLRKLSPRNFMDLDPKGNNLRMLIEQLDQCSVNDDFCLLDAWDALGGKKEDDGNENQEEEQKDNTPISPSRISFWEKNLFNTSNEAKIISHCLTYLFCQGKIQGCTLIYSKFHNILTQEPTQENILPLCLNPNPQGERINDGLFTYEPNAKKVLEKGLNLLVDNIFQSRLQEHRLSEYGARINAMENAENNAKDLFSTLRLEYNHLRQSKITAEIIEINNY